MLDKVAAFCKAASGDIERSLGYDGSQYERLMNMRLRFEHQGTGEPLNLHAVRYQEGMRSNRRGFAHWFLKPKCGEEIREVHYEGVLEKLSHSANAGTLLDYERNWASNALLNNTSAHTWNFGIVDPAVSANIERRLLEQRLGKLENFTGAAYDTNIEPTPESHRISCDQDDFEFVASMHMEGELITAEAVLENLPAVPLHVVPDDSPADAYSNHGLHWIFEFSGSIESVEVGRGKHRIKRAV
jgi:hypothetical protein